jgi:hypothetical protein
MTTRELKWDSLANGILLRTAADDNFEIFLSIDKKIEYEQNLSKLPLTVLILNSVSNALPYLLSFAPFVLTFLESSPAKFLYVMESDGSVNKVTSPRP